VVPAAAAPTAVAPPDFRPEMSRIYFAIEAARTGERALIVQFVGIEGGDGVSTIAAGFARRTAREAQNAILLVTCGNHAHAIQPDVAALPSLLDLFLAGRPLTGASAPLDGDGMLEGRDRIRWARLGAEAQDDLNPRLLTAFAEELRRAFSVIVLDCPPTASSPLAGVLSRIADGTVVVAAAGRSRRRDLERTVAEIARMGGQVVGLVLNRQRDWLPAWLRRHLA
jgi:Mrp family chromosome partitioning ATPase